MCRLFRIAIWVLVIFLLANAGIAEQVLTNRHFNLRFTPEGLVSLKRPNDVYDTDYILSRNSIGDVLISYRPAGAEDWKRISKAKLKSVNKKSASYNIFIRMPSFLSSARPGASHNSRRAYALNDQAHIENSSSRASRYLSWWPKRGSKEWAQYDFPKEVTVSAVEVYWFDDHYLGGISRVPKSWRLLYRDGEQWKEVANPSGYGVDKDKFVRVTFKPVKTRALRIEVQLYEELSGGMHEWRVENDEDKKIREEYTKTAAAIAKEIKVTSTFALKDSALFWTINLKNLTDKPLEIGDVGLPLRFNSRYVWDKTETYTKRLIRHSLISGNGSFIYWMRTNTEPPYLLMTPVGGTKLEYFDADSTRGRIYCPYIHSKAKGTIMRQKGGNWRQQHTGIILTPKGKRGDSANYIFKFRWADGYDGVRDLLYEEGKFDVHVVPGMTVPGDLFALVSVRTKNKIKSITPEHPAQTKIEYLGRKQKDTRVYKVKFSRLGENFLTINYGKGQHVILEFFVTEPLETLIKKRAAFLISRQQHRDAGKWYNGLVSDWDQQNKILRSPDDRDGLRPYVVACDDPGLCKVPYAASKNVDFPSEKEIEGIDYYIKNYVWGGLQCTEKEPYPYAIYGIPNWKVNRESDDPGRNGRKHLWRIYDYPHIILLYYRMYQIAKFYPEIKTYLSKDEYLTRAFGTARAYFTVPMEIEKWSAYGTGTYNELIIPDLIKALYDEGKAREADILRKHWEKKVEHFVNDDPYLFGSEFPFDSTGFESTHAQAKYALANVNKKDSTLKVKLADVLEFLEKQIKLNIACRGWLETAYYYLGSDYRGGGSARYTLSYMSQMGGWSIVDYALYHSKEPMRYLRLGYASYLSSWALMNTGTPESNYGYWYPGKGNDGAAGGGFEPAPFARSWLGKRHGRGSWFYGCEIDLGFSGALRTAATIVAEDPTFGLFAYGGLLEKTGTGIKVIPKDGLRKRFHIIKEKSKLHMLLDRDGFAKDKPIVVDNSLRRIQFTLENRAHSQHITTLDISGLPAGTYIIEGIPGGGRIKVADGANVQVRLKIGDSREYHVTIKKISSS